MNRNPIFIEYYSHEGCNCYKVKNPYTVYANHTIVLCPVSEGLDKARLIAAEVLTKEMFSALNEKI